VAVPFLPKPCVQSSHPMHTTCHAQLQFGLIIVLRCYEVHNYAVLSSLLLLNPF
jgi:hypothetical protein